MAGVALFNVTVIGPALADAKLPSLALLALTAHVPLALVTVITPVEELIVHPVPVALNDTAPVPLPPEVVAVPVEPKVTLAGTDKVKVDWLVWPMESLTVPLALL